MAKMRDSAGVLAGEGVVSLTGVGGLEVAEYRGFVGGVVEGLRLVFSFFVSWGLGFGLGGRKMVAYIPTTPPKHTERTH